jgi:hypothetical protein
LELTNLPVGTPILKEYSLFFRPQLLFAGI